MSFVTNGESHSRFIKVILIVYEFFFSFAEQPNTMAERVPAKGNILGSKLKILYSIEKEIVIK